MLVVVVRLLVTIVILLQYFHVHRRELKYMATLDILVDVGLRAHVWYIYVVVGLRAIFSIYVVVGLRAMFFLQVLKPLRAGEVLPKF